MENLSHQSDKWTLGKKIFFRFFFIFYGISVLFFICNLLPWLPRQITFDSFIIRGYSQLLDSLTIAIGKYVLNVNVNTDENGPDSLFGYVQFFSRLLIAAIGCMIWSIADRKRDNYRVLLYWLTVFVRYALIIPMIGYGLGKIFLLQFNPRFSELESLVRPFGDFSPPELFNRFMGYSKSYQIFTGFAEVLGALLLLFRRTATIGALLVFGVMSNVLMLNLGFGFGVALDSLRLLIMAAFLLIVDSKRIINSFFLNKPVSGRKNQFTFPKRWMRIVKVILKLYFIFYFAVYQLFRMFQPGSGYNTYVRGPDPPLYGIYKVETFLLNKDTLPPLLTDTIRWKRMVFKFPSWLDIQMMNDSGSDTYNYEVDSVNRKINVSIWGDTVKKYIFNYSEPQSDIMILHGKLEQDSVFIQLRKEDLNKYRLKRWKTGWIKQRNR